jgi:nitroreductase
MDIQQAILTRRSIRKYTGEPVSEEQIKAVIRAGTYAPSAHNGQPWRFVVVRDAGMLEKIAAFHPYGKMAPQAGCAIIVCGDEAAQPADKFLGQDCGACIENMLLSAHGLGLGTVWCGLHPVKRLTTAFGEWLKLPEGIIPIGMVVIGHSAETREVKERYDAQKVHWETW